MVSTRALLARTLCVPVIFTSACLGAAAGNPFSKGPWVQFPQVGLASVMWESSNRQPARVRFSPEGGPDRVVVSPEPRKMVAVTSSSNPKQSVTNVYYVYCTRISGVSPGGTYSYSVEMDGSRSDTRQFTTLDPWAKTARFAVYGDSRSDPKQHKLVVSRLMQHQPQFVLHTGDLVARGQDYPLWSREFFGPAADLISSTPFFSVIGNHEQDGTNYLAYFDLPGRELWYSFDAGPVHVLALDFRLSKEDHEQFRFAKEDLLKSTAPWKIVVLHTPMFNIGGHASSWGHDSYLPLFHSSGVDLVLAGHSHLYERFRPLSAQEGSHGSAITHITTGGGGANLHPALAHPAVLAFDSTNHFMVFEASSESLHAQAIRVDGVVLDEFEIHKARGKLEPEYISSAYPERQMKLYYEFNNSLTGQLDRIPVENRPASMVLTIPSRKASNTPGELVLALSPESAASYELADGATRIKTPAPGKTNLVTLKVSVKPGVTVSTNSSRELVPALYLRADAYSGSDSTVVYGGKARVQLKPAKVSAASVSSR